MAIHSPLGRESPIPDRPVSATSDGSSPPDRTRSPLWATTSDPPRSTQERTEPRSEVWATIRPSVNTASKLLRSGRAFPVPIVANVAVAPPAPQIRSGPIRR